MVMDHWVLLDISPLVFCSFNMWYFKDSWGKLTGDEGDLSHLSRKCGHSRSNLTQELTNLMRPLVLVWSIPRYAGQQSCWWRSYDFADGYTLSVLKISKFKLIRVAYSHVLVMGQADDAEPPDADVMGEMTEENAMADWGQQFFLSFQIQILVQGNQRRLGHVGFCCLCCCMVNVRKSSCLAAKRQRWISRWGFGRCSMWI